MVMYLIGYNFYHDKEKWTNDSLIKYLGLPQESIEDTIKELEDKNLLLEVGEDQPYYLPAKDIESIKLSEIVDSARVNNETQILESNHLSKPEVDQITDKIEDAIHTSLGNLTLRDLVVNKVDESS